MQNRSIVFKCAPFCSCNTCIVLWMGQKECVCSMRCLAKLAVLNAFLRSWNRVAKLLPVCPKYALLQSGHINLYTPDRECMSEVCWLCINSFCIALLVRNAIFMSHTVIRLPPPNANNSRAQEERPPPRIPHRTSTAIHNHTQFISHVYRPDDEISASATQNQ